MLLLQLGGFGNPCWLFCNQISRVKQRVVQYIMARDSIPFPFGILAAHHPVSPARALSCGPGPGRSPPQQPPSVTPKPRIDDQVLDMRGRQRPGCYLRHSRRSETSAYDSACGHRLEVTLTSAADSATIAGR